uniref:Secreted protein n=1 Tax=Heterorhabditis bacteriophora TaxID=37862 RepID=A0A1I7WHQ0_HETBA
MFNYLMITSIRFVLLLVRHLLLYWSIWLKVFRNTGDFCSKLHYHLFVCFVLCYCRETFLYFIVIAYICFHRLVSINRKYYIQSVLDIQSSLFLIFFLAIFNSFSSNRLFNISPGTSLMRRRIRLAVPNHDAQSALRMTSNEGLNKSTISMLV